MHQNSVQKKERIHLSVRAARGVSLRLYYGITEDRKHLRLDELLHKNAVLCGKGVQEGILHQHTAAAEGATKPVGTLRTRLTIEITRELWRRSGTLCMQVHGPTLPLKLPCFLCQ
jgi:hypothetical protein